MVRTTYVRLAVAVAGGYMSCSILLADPPESVGSRSSEAPADSTPFSGLTCPSCHAEDQLVPIRYGYPAGRPKPTIADGVTCPPLVYHRGGCCVRSDRWHCNKCRSKYTDLPTKSRLEAVPLCIKELKNGTTCRRRAALHLLKHINLAETAALPVIADALIDKDSLVRRGAIRALVRTPYSYPDDMRIFERLLERLTDESDTVRKSAIRALWMLETDSGLLIRALTEALDDLSPTVRSGAATAMAMKSIDWERPQTTKQQLGEAIPKLATLLRDETSFVRSAAFQSLMTLGDTFDISQDITLEMYATLERALDDYNDRTPRMPHMSSISNGVRSSRWDGIHFNYLPAVRVLLRLADQRNVPPTVAGKMYATLDRQLTDEDESERYGAIRSVERLMTKLNVPRSTIIRLTELSVRDASAPVRKKAAECLAQISARLEAQAREAPDLN